MSNITTIINAPVNIALITGPLLLANLFNWGLFGVLAVQTYLYYVAFPKDSPKLKAIVGVSCILEVVQVVISTYDAFRVSARGWGNPAELDAIGLDWFSVPIMAGIISCLCRLFYAWRIYLLSRTYWIATPVSALTIVSTGFSIYNGVASARVGRLSGLRDSVIFDTATIWASTSVACDVLITGSMFYFLWRERKKSNIRKTSNILIRLIKLTVETGFLCAAVTTLSLVFFVTSRSTNLYTVPVMLISKMYSNSLLAVLNSRIRIVGGRYMDDLDFQEIMCSPSMTGMRLGDASSLNNFLEVIVTSEVTRFEDKAEPLRNHVYISK